MEYVRESGARMKDGIGRVWWLVLVKGLVKLKSSKISRRREEMKSVLYI